MSFLQRIAEALKPPAPDYGRRFELDELCTYVGSKENRVWVAFAIERETRSLAAFTVGRRSKTILRKVTDHILDSCPEKLYTDRLNLYPS